ncbi:paternally-expressed gene 3 protein isoform X1 [Sciurus carolinensis]|uniref:paternally-expressed gene 3 protein isoform X1 n=1 Tax=Sciurus carolinensis TaxID=30640 RepID=UPI001FB3F595|nr:paternally-expressed gene 3 protein isoform X1 [Sciurus carolinensis]
MHQPDDDSNSDMTSDDEMGRGRGESPPPRPGRSSSSDREQEWDRRGRSHDVLPRDRWLYTRSPRSRLPQRDLSLPVMAKRGLEIERDDRGSVDHESRSQDAESYQNIVNLNQDRKPQNPIQDNMENYRKLLSLGVQLAEDDRHSHMTQGHSSRSKRSVYPSTSRGLKSMPEAKKSAHRRGICEDESCHGVIMEKFIKDVSRGPTSGRARESADRPQRLPRVSDDNWKDASFNRRESVIQERGAEGSAFRGGFRFNSSLVSRKRVLERKRRYRPDTVHDHKGCARKKPFDCGSEMRKAMSLSSPSGLSAPSFSEPQPVGFGPMAYVCDECGRSFSVISEFVEHQIMHTRENLYEYGESFIHSVAVSEVQKSQAGGKRFECKECGETFNKSAALAEHRKTHARECRADRREQQEAAMPSPTFSELQKIYGKDKFYECRVCRETFLHSSALIEHQKIHNRGNSGEDKGNEHEPEREREHRETFMPSAALSEFQKMYNKEKIYECKVCGETFLHSSSLKEHQKIHTRGNPFENKSKVCEETFIPGQSLKRRQKTHTKERLFNSNDGRDAFMQSSDLHEHQKIHSRKSFFESRAYEKCVLHSMPFPESQRSHTITRPPENEEGEKMFTISTSPDGDQRLATTAPLHRRPVTHSFTPAEAQRSHSAVGRSRPKAVAGSTLQSSDAARSSCAVSEYERSVIRSLAAPRALKRPSGSGRSEGDEQGESSSYVSDLDHKRRRILARENPYDGGKNSNYKDSATQSAPYAESQRWLAGEGPSEFKQDGRFSIPSSKVREHQKARAKKKYIEHRGNETSVIHSLHFGELQTVRPREKLYECQECGESFARSSDLTEHQKIHNREKPSGSRTYARSVIRSLAPTDPQTSYAQERYAEEQARSKLREFGQSATVSSCFSARQNIRAQEKSYGKETRGPEPHSKEPRAQEPHSEEPRAQELHSGEPRAQEPHSGEPRAQEPHSREPRAQEPHSGEPRAQEPHAQEPRGKEPRGQEPRGQEPHGVETHGEETSGQTAEDAIIQGSDLEEGQKDEPDDTIYECQACGLGFADLTDLTSHQDVHSGKSAADRSENTRPQVHTHSIDALQKEFTGEQLFECPKCGESFIHSSFLFEHQRIHEQDQLYSMKGCDDGFISLLPVKPRRNRAAERNPALAGSAIRCLQCGQGFIHSSALNEHMRHHREDELLEQSEAAEEVLIHGFALTEFQGSEPEEKLFECTICGECFFTAKELGDHHTKVHKDEPYEYGPSYTHTSFLSEPFRKPVPFYECKDCGQAFIHDTVLTKHTVFHPEEEEDEEDEEDEEEEEEAAAAQEVEANVLVPQEVLRIQGSNIEAAEPEVEAAEPEVEAAEPEVEAVEPNGEAEGPGGEAAEPHGEAEQPSVDADEPDGAGIEDPEEGAEGPEVDADGPEGLGVGDPEEEGEDEEIQVAEPYDSCHECTEAFPHRAASGAPPKAQASMVLLEPAGAPGECSGYIQHASTSTSTGSPEPAGEKRFRCDVCGQLFSDRLSLARHQNSHTG